MRSLRAWRLAPWFVALLPACGGKSGLYIAGASSGDAGRAGGVGSGARGGSIGLGGGPSSGGSGGSKAGFGGGNPIAGGAGQAGNSASGGSAGSNEPICGNGIVELGESCDDGDQNSGDGCRACVGIVDLTAGQAHTCARLSDGTVRCWGYNEWGNLGLGDTAERGIQPMQLGDQLPAVDLAGETALALSAGGSHTCALLGGGFVKCWGNNQSGRLGLGDIAHRGDEPNEMGASLSLIDLGSDGVQALSAGFNHTCALLPVGTLKCWGSGSYGMLGLGSDDDRGDQAGEMGDLLPAVELGSLVLAVSVGLHHSCALLEDGAVKCWGANGSGQLGLGDVISRGVFENQMGANLPPVDLAAKAVAVVTGYYHSCALLQGGAVKCWGGNFCGQLGLGDTADRGDEANEMGSALPVVDLQGAVVALAGGGTHTCGLFDDGKLKCWGCNDTGQLGLSDVLHRGDDPGDMGAALRAVDLGSELTVRAVVTGGAHTCALLDSGMSKCWGLNTAGQLGLGNGWEAAGDQPNEMGTELPYVAVP